MAIQHAAAQEPDNADYRSAIAVADRLKPLCRCENGFRDAFIQGPFLFGLLATGYALPLPHCPAQIAATLVLEDELACETLADGRSHPCKQCGRRRLDAANHEGPYKPVAS